jgi:hypothetical protein
MRWKAVHFSLANHTLFHYTTIDNSLLNYIDINDLNSLINMKVFYSPFSSFFLQTDLLLG